MLSVSFLSKEAPYAIIAMALLLMVILRPLKAMRHSLINTSVFFLACIIGDLLAGLMLSEHRFSAIAQLLRQLSIFGEGLAVIRFIGLAWFNVACPAPTSGFQASWPISWSSSATSAGPFSASTSPASN